MAEKQITGKIIKGVGGLYQVALSGAGVITCSPKGILRYQHIRPLIGDNVELSIQNEQGNIEKILPRQNSLIRPAVANVDQAVIVFAGMDPEPHWNLLDRFLIQMKHQDIPVSIVINKSDKLGEAQKEDIRRIYEKSGSPLYFVAAKEREGTEVLRALLARKTTVLAGPSGVGKSTILNALLPEAAAETGEISEKIRRGKHTTRHTELFCLGEDSYLLDTPGFSSLNLPEITAEELEQYYEEFGEYRRECRFLGCVHQKEPDCGVKRALSEGCFSAVRYENYSLLYEELAMQQKKHYNGKKNFRQGVSKGGTKK